MDKILSFKDKFTFGKYKGQTIDDIAKLDPTYVRWCIDTIAWFKMSGKDKKSIYKLAEEADNNYFKAKLQQARNRSLRDFWDADDMYDCPYEDYYDYCD